MSIAHILNLNVWMCVNVKDSFHKIVTPYSCTNNFKMVIVCKIYSILWKS